MDEMTVADLIARLGDYPEDAVVRLATQPNYPLQFTLAGVADEQDVLDLAEPDSTPVAKDVVWLVTGEHPSKDPNSEPASPYANPALWDAAQVDAR